MKQNLSEIQKIRHRNVRSLIDSLGTGGAKEFALKLGKSATQTSQFAGATPHRGISEKMARLIEESFGLEKFSLDSSKDNDLRGDRLDQDRLALAVKYATRAIKFLPKSGNEDEQLSKLIVNLYVGEHSKSEINPDDSEKQAMVSASLEAHNIIQKVKKEPGVSISQEEEQIMYSDLLDDLYFAKRAKINKKAE